ncbi:hypothetical protein SDC9_205252 [bioreactor metagenome]|uniref:Uncharacterized protein n=1 Tax=bioreactor metagenome TaxID=1076179 RepID=A0A645J1K2_9ZZZZ
MVMTSGTKTPLTLSASLAIGALEEAAFSTNLMICPRVVSLPTFRAWNLKKPALLIVAPMTRSPFCLVTGMLSPVIADSSTEDMPSVTTPSTGILCPGLTAMISPTITSSTGISISSPFRTTRAICGTSLIRELIAEEVFFLDKLSKYFPKVIKVRIMPADSK